MTYEDYIYLRDLALTSLAIGNIDDDEFERQVAELDGEYGEQG